MSTFNRSEGRGTSRPRTNLDPMVLRLIDNAPAYEPRATVNDGLCINEVIHIQAQDDGSASVLHAKWQEEGHIDRLTSEECDILGRAGYRIHRDRDGYWAWWREKKLTHLRLVAATQGWMSSKAPHPKGAKWDLIGSFVNPVVPYFEDYPITPQSIVREGLTLALLKIQKLVPDNVFSEKFFVVAKRLCDEAVARLEEDDEWFNDILLRVPMVEVQGSGIEVQYEPEGDYTGGVVKS